ncbi:hypothetical protein P7228_07970 [Altererythrobacter arenosus]|uniref:Uncharacterized protein n=1 Tax=Altererythrobacter arenosus TaxID=3032592 RepID=A0ABY8FM63_9SPHN|nr:hypothetical protein [Altererythrobacter sp. CAU 1644]WFL75947.1 hypothetical protein P7228_07970 [Altererythrobacter sp. CAU 1644]
MRDLEIKRRILRAGRAVLIGSVAGAALASQPAFAQEEVWPSNAEAHPGEIVYSRDVPYGTATRRFAQGEARTVNPDQTILIENSLLVGLQPLSDAEQAAVSAPLVRSLEVGRNAIDVGLSVVTATGSGGDFTRSESGASSTGSIISQGLSVLPSALAVIGNTTGSGQ